MKTDRCKSTQDEEGTVNGGNGAKPVKWASHVLQRRAWSKAWLALLRLPLPQDILKKARMIFVFQDAMCLGKVVGICLQRAPVVLCERDLGLWNPCG